MILKSKWPPSSCVHNRVCAASRSTEAETTEEAPLLSPSLSQQPLPAPIHRQTTQPFVKIREGEGGGGGEGEFERRLRAGGQASSLHLQRVCSIRRHGCALVNTTTAPSSSSSSSSTTTATSKRAKHQSAERCTQPASHPRTVAERRWIWNRPAFSACFGKQKVGGARRPVGKAN